MNADELCEYIQNETNNQAALGNNGKGNLKKK
jgi:hypothetical protein